MTRAAARWFGIIYLVVGILGFVPGVSTPMADGSGMVMLLGLFPVNAFHDIVHIIIGLAGIAVAGSLANARSYFRVVAVVYGLLTILGLIPATSTLWGLCPLMGWDIVLHLVTAIVAIYFGWKALAPDETAAA